MAVQKNIGEMVGENHTCTTATPKTTAMVTVHIKKAIKWRDRFMYNNGAEVRSW